MMSKRGNLPLTGFFSLLLLCQVFPQSHLEAESVKALTNCFQTDSQCLLQCFLHGIPSWIAAGMCISVLSSVISPTT